MSYLLSLPAGSGAFLFGALMVVVTWLAYVFIRPFLRLFVRSQVYANEIIGNALSIFAVLFGLLLGLLSISTYQSAAEVEHYVIDEAANVLALYRSADAYEEPFRTQVHTALRDYAQYVVDEAWPIQQQGKLPEGGGKHIQKIYNAVFQFSPQTEAQKNMHSDTIGLFAKIRDGRLKRLAALVRGIPDVLWTVVWIGAFSTLVLILLLDMNFSLHILLSGIVAFFLGIVIFLLLSLDNPFRGEVGVTDEFFRRILGAMKPIEGL